MRATMPPLDDQQAAKWELEIKRAFAVHPRPGEVAADGIDPIDLREVGTPALKQLLADFLGVDSASDDLLADFLKTSASSEDSSILDPDERRQRQALAIGACAWLFVPRVEIPDFEKLFPTWGGKPAAGSPKTIDTLGTRKAWAYSHYLTARTGSNTLLRGSSKSGDNFRFQFRDALVSAVMRRLRRHPGPNPGTEDRTLAPRPYESQHSGLHRLLASAAEVLDRPPARMYPPSMRPSRISASITVSRPAERTQLANRPTWGLYDGNTSTSNGELGVQTLLNQRRSTVLGDPGTGKSTLLKAAVISHLQGSGESLAVFARLSTLGEILNRRRPRSAPEIVENILIAAQETMGFAISKPLQRDATELFMEPSDCVLVALDGLDEVLNPQHLRYVEEALQRLEPTSIRIIISSRIAGYRGVLDGTDYIIDRLGANQIERTFDLWFEDAHSRAGRDRLNAALSESASLRELVAIPVMAVFAAFVADRGDVPTREADLYQAYIERYLQHEWKEPDRRRTNHLELTAALEAAEQLAWAMALRPSGPDTDESWTEVATLRDIFEMAPEHRDEINQLVTVDGLLTPHGTSSTLLTQHYRWIHRTLQEHLVARSLVRRLNEDRSAALRLVYQIVRRPHVWLETLTRAYRQLSPDIQAAILNMYAEGHAAFDLGSNVYWSLSRIGSYTHPSIRKNYQSAARDGGWW